jgi:16S rRNA (guanine966-N2)-methyltransferase
MPDRVKEAVFDILGSYWQTPGALPSIPVADVFAGSGSMGIEALSRGATFCRFLEQHANALHTLRANLHSLAVDARASVVACDAWRHGLLPPPAEGSFALVILDPPYPDSREDAPHGKLARFLEAASRQVEPGTIAVLHHDARVGLTFQPPWSRFDTRKYGTGAVTFLRHAGPARTMERR